MRRWEEVEQMKDPMRMPTNLARLQDLTNRLETWHAEGGEPTDGDMIDDTIAWLNYTLASLENRKQYHRKRALKLGLMKKMAETLLSEDELEAIDQAAEKQLVGLEEGQIE